MAYITKEEIEQYTGFAYTDFQESGLKMDESQWNTFLATNIPNIDQIINRYCNVTSFDPNTTITEYHSGRGASDDEGVSYSGYFLKPYSGTYIESDREFYLREPVVSITLVEEDTSSKTSAPAWVSRVARAVGVAGDYEVVIKNELTKIVFWSNIPSAGYNNVRITYKCGYPYTSAQYKEIKLQALRMMANFLLHKKKIQEAVNIRALGVRDYSQMFDIMNESVVLSENVMAVLSKYRRIPLDGDIFA
jgi:hypothetical protein